MGFLEKGAWLLFVIFLALKIAGVTDMSWLGVFAPILINYSIFLFGLALIALGSWRQRRRNRSWIDRL